MICLKDLEKLFVGIFIINVELCCRWIFIFCFFFKNRFVFDKWWGERKWIIWLEEFC